MNSESLTEDRVKMLTSIRENCEEKMKDEALKMINSKLLPEARVGENVTLLIPEMDRSKADDKNILGGISLIKDDKFEIQCASGDLNGWFSRSQFQPVQQKFILPSNESTRKRNAPTSPQQPKASRK